MTIDKEKINYLLNIDFNNNSGYSYTELLDFLKCYRSYYRNVLENYEWFKSELNSRDEILKNLNYRVKDLEEKTRFQSMQITSLKSCLIRKLTFWERISGKVKI